MDLTKTGKVVHLNTLSVPLYIPGKENATLNLIVLCAKRYIYMYHQSRWHKPLIFNDIN